MRIALALAAVLASACASQMALLSGEAKKSVVVAAPMDAAFAAGAEAGRDLKFSVSEKRAKNFISASRGMGYGEYSTVFLRLSEEGGKTRIDFSANSNKGSQQVLDEYLAALAKRAKIE